MGKKALITGITDEDEQERQRGVPYVAMQSHLAGSFDAPEYISYRALRFDLLTKSSKWR